MKMFVSSLIITSFYLLPIVFCLEALSLNSSVTMTTEGDKIHQITSTSEQSEQSFLECRNDNTTLAVNSSFLMACSKDDNLKRFVWWFNGTIIAGPVPTPTGIEYYTTNVSESNLTSHLHIKSIQWNNTGMYKCNVGNTTVMQRYLNVVDPKLRIDCLDTDCTFMLTANVSQHYLLRCYVNQNTLHKPITWKINNLSSDTLIHQIELNNSINEVFGNMYLASTIVYTAKRGHTLITCSMGRYSTSITVKVLYEEESYLPLNILAVSIIVLVVILCTITAIVYCLWKKKEHPSRKTSPQSFLRVAYENGNTAEQFDTQADVLKNSDGGSFITPVCDEWKRLLEENNQLYGLKLLCCRYEDNTDVFSEAVFVAGDYKDRFVVRSVSGQSTLESLEDFRKFQIRLTELPTHSNVLEVLGCYTNKLPYRICYEYFPNKTVRDYLFEDFQNLQNSKMHDMQAQKLFCIAHGIARGMFFLKENQLDHVAVRVEKVLYFGASTCKLYDFSLRNQSEKKAMNLLEKSESLAWLGPDLLLRKEYNHLTDIWAYGVLMWELWSGGELPFSKSPRLTMEMNMRNEKMLQQPANCPGVIYSLMLSCWKKKHMERPSYHDIVTELENLKSSVCKPVIEDYELEPVPGPSFYTSLDETTYDHLSTL